MDGYEKVCLMRPRCIWANVRSPSVEFCGYSAPHPSEPVIHLRIQMYDRKSALTALNEALDNLDKLAVTIEDAYKSSLRKGAYERFEER